jgi:hypothetical protein
MIEVLSYICIALSLLFLVLTAHQMRTYVEGGTWVNLCKSMTYLVCTLAYGFLYLAVNWKA